KMEIMVPVLVFILILAFFGIPMVVPVIRFVMVIMVPVLVFILILAFFEVLVVIPVIPLFMLIMFPLFIFVFGMPEVMVVWPMVILVIIIHEFASPFIRMVV
ncbi:hypothetical protein, partial [Cytobacillus oceanisediminis]|uniref:hypothetical protein n=1 Tax=Cytobacillus oceanisediminis TaxID=665099 RepID=UPI001C92C6A3